VDLKIIEIIGVESPVLDGLPVGESGDPVTPPPSTADLSQLSPSMNEDDEPAGTSAGVNVTPKSDKVGRKRKPRFVHSDILDMKRKKQTELLEVSIYNEKLKTYEMEQKLNLPPSKFTREFHTFEVIDEYS